MVPFVDNVNDFLSHSAILVVAGLSIYLNNWSGIHIKFRRVSIHKRTCIRLKTQKLRCKR